MRSNNEGAIIFKEAPASSGAILEITVNVMPIFDGGIINNYIKIGHPQIGRSFCLSRSRLCHDDI
jgi:hypothetical protein